MGDILTVDEERAILARQAARNASDEELREHAAHEWLGPFVREEIARRELQASMPKMSTLALCRMIDHPEGGEVAEGILEARRGLRIQRDELAEHGVVSIA